MKPYRFCPYCATELTPLPGSPHLASHCPRCSVTHFRSAKPCVGALVERGGKLLLARRAVPPYLGMWDVVGGFLNPDEDPLDGVRREVLEETGLEVTVGPFVGAWIDRYGDDGDYTLNLHFVAYAGPGEATPQDDVAALQWFLPDQLPSGIGFENGRKAVEAWRERRLRELSP